MKREKAARPRLARETTRLYMGQLADLRLQAALPYLGTMLFTFCDSIAIPYFLGALVDELIQPNRSSDAVYHYLLLIILFGLLAFGISRFIFFFRNRVITQVEQRLNMLVFSAYEKQEYTFFTNNFVGSLVARAQRFVNTFRDLYDNTAFNGMGLLVQLVGSVVILGFKAPLLSVIFMIAAIVVICLVLISTRYKLAYLRKNAEAGSAVTAALADNLTNNLAVKVYAGRQWEQDRFWGVTEQRRQSFAISTWKNEQVRMLRHLSSVGFMIASTAVLVWLALRGKITFGTILLTQLYLNRLEQSLWNISQVSERLEESMADAAEMTEVILREQEVRDVPEPISFGAKRGEVHFADVSFRYQDADDGDVLFNKLSLKIAAGDKVGLVGPSGGGKTTLTKLLLRFMDISSGKIQIDGQDIALARQDDVRRAIAYVPQEPLLFHRSVRENIAYGDPLATQSDIVQAAKQAHAHDFIEKLPHGYDTLVGERGVKLSGGEKQRVAIARAMLKKSPIVVLDEATSALDSKSEKAIVSALDNLMKGRTTIVIAHRLSTIRKLDRIIVLQNGAISEEGSHEELLKKGGLYADLWQHQSGEFLPEELASA